MSFNYLGISIKNLVKNPIKNLRYCDHEELKRVKISHDEFPYLLDSIKDLDFVNEVSLISTCNRFEIYFFTTKELNVDEINIIQNIIKSINKTNIDLNYLKDNQAQLHFIRTYCGLNSGLVTEHEIIMQIQIAFRQSLDMNYLSHKGEYLLNFAQSLKARLDNEMIFNGGYSYCGVALEQAIRKQKIENLSNKKILILGSGGTAHKSAQAVLDLGASANKIKIIHRISSSSNQVYSLKEIGEFEFMRAKNGYHVERVKNAIYLSDIVIFAIDSKLPVVNLDPGVQSKIFDFNSNPSCTFSVGYNLDRYLSSSELEKMVRSFSEKNLNNEGFKSKIALAENYIKSMTADTLISRL